MSLSLVMDEMFPCVANFVSRLMSGSQTCVIESMYAKVLILVKSMRAENKLLSEIT